MPFFVYVLQNPEGRLYVGQTSDVQARLQRHQGGKVFWTKARGPWELLFVEPFPTRAQAMAQEKRLKNWKSKDAVLKYIAQVVESRLRRE